MSDPSPGRSWRTVALLLVVSLALALLVREQVAEAFVIPSGSMERTLHGCPGCAGDRVVVERFGMTRHAPRRGEVVVFDGHGSWGRNPGAVTATGPLAVALRRVGLRDDGGWDYVKRVIGLPGDRVACCSPDGSVTVQPPGAAQPVPLSEPYLFEDAHQPFCAAGVGPGACPPGAPGVLVPPGRVWLMGDHRSASADSRAHLGDTASGTVGLDPVVGRVVVRVWPPARFRVLRVPDLLH